MLYLATNAMVINLSFPFTPYKKKDIFTDTDVFGHPGYASYIASFGGYQTIPIGVTNIWSSAMPFHLLRYRSRIRQGLVSYRVQIFRAGVLKENLNFLLEPSSFDNGQPQWKFDLMMRLEPELAPADLLTIDASTTIAAAQVAGYGILLQGLSD